MTTRYWVTLSEFIEDLEKELRSNPEWGDLPVVFATGTGTSDLYYLSIYTADDHKKVYIDIGE